jgi:hypothetical protein
MVNVRLPELPPPGAGLNTVTSAEPALERSAGVISASSCELLTKVVVREDPPHRTTEPEMKFVPVTDNCRARLPAGALVGAIDVAVGVGFCGVEGEDLLPPPHPEIIRASAPI